MWWKHANREYSSAPVWNSANLNRGPVNAIGVANIVNQSICGSATNRRAWRDFNHVMDPRTLLSVTDIVATWVVADSALVADGLATALFFVSPETLLSEYTFEYVIVRADYSYEKSSGFPGDMF